MRPVRTATSPRSSSTARRNRLSALLALLLVLIQGVSLASASSARADGGAAACQASGGVYMYIQDITQGCSRATGNGLDAINSVATTSWGNDGFLLQINGSPAKPDPKKYGYWSYWFWTGSSWQYANVGPYSDTDLSGKVRAWKYIGLKMSDKVPPAWTPPAPENKPTTRPATQNPGSGSNGGSNSNSKSGSQGGSQGGSTPQGQGDTQTGTQSEAQGQTGTQTQGQSTAGTEVQARGSAEAKAGSGSPSASVNPSTSGTTSSAEAARKLAADAPTGSASGDSSDDSGSGSRGSPWALVGAAGLVVAAVVGSVIAVRRRR